MFHDQFFLTAHLTKGLCQAYPADADYLAWRGLLYETKGDFARAAKDYEEVLRLKPKLREIPLNLRDAYRQLHEPCKALATQKRYTDLYSDMAIDPGILELATKLQTECAAKS